MFHAIVEGAEELAHDWANVRAAVRGAMRRGVRLGVTEGAALAKSTHKFQNQTGHLEASIEGRVTGNSEDEHRGELVASAKYASYVEGGTRAHEIKPKKEGGLLHWQSPQGTHHYARAVSHPGTKPLPFMGPAYQKCEAVIIRETEIGIREAQTILDR